MYKYGYTRLGPRTLEKGNIQQRRETHNLHMRNYPHMPRTREPQTQRIA